MLNTFGNQKQFQLLNNLLNKESVRLTNTQVKDLIKTDLLSIREKLEILELHLGLRFLTEVYSKIKYSNIQDKDGYTRPTPASTKALEHFLQSKFSFPIKKSSRKTESTKTYDYLINIFSNQAIKEYFSKFEKKISDLEIGILYGYHPKAVLAFCGYIKSSSPPKAKEAYQYYNSKVYPLEYFNEVDEYHKLKWEMIKKFCPEIIEMAEEEFSLSLNK